MAHFTITPRLIAQGSKTFHNLPLPWKHPDFGLPDEISQMAAFAGTEFISALVSTPVIGDVLIGLPYLKYILLF